jgi:hypothetical protein
MAGKRKSYKCKNYQRENKHVKLFAFATLLALGSRKNIDSLSRT